ncbi:hypothetical protein [Methylobacter svalbardensis]|uniref:hypothetical protein n=1 Tax=Methylobacter svalbardensis TaxID=3080016 RepID=UPI0030EDC42A
MDALEIIAIFVVLLITIFIVLKRRKKCSSCSPKEAHISKPRAPELKKQPSKIKLVDKPVVNAEPTTVVTPEPKPANKPTVNIEPSPSAKPQAKETMENNGSLPQDSILRRHYLAHLCTMIETLAPLRPTESVLCRHYDTMIVARLDECLSNKNAMEQLIYDYEKNKSIVNIESTVRPKIKETVESNSSLPQDSILRRHYLAYLCTMIETLAPLRPTESVLCRHYDTMIVARLDECLSNKNTMKQLIYDYEHIK